MTPPTDILDPLVIAKISNLLLRARSVVEGLLSGLHRSPHRGSSVEFIEHKEYSPGDELKHFDWKAWGRSDRYYVKQFEEETNLKCHILLDCSRSMAYASHALSKFDYATTLAACLAYLMLKQSDSMGLLIFTGDSIRHIPPRSTSSHLQVIVEALQQAVPSGKASIPDVLRDFAEKTKRRGLIVLVSDLLDDVPSVTKALKQLRHRRNEVIVFHVLDPDEIEFPFEGTTLFESLEDSRNVLCHPGAIRKAYLQQLDRFITGFKQECAGDDIDYCLMNTRSPLDFALTRYLSLRERFACYPYRSSIRRT